MGNNLINSNLKKIILLGVVTALISPFLLTRKAQFSFFSFADTGQIGDTIGGITAPILNLINIVLLFYSFNEQFKANQEQSKLLIEEKSRNQLDKNFRLILDLFNHFKEESEKLPIEDIFHQFDKADLNFIIVKDKRYEILVLRNLLEIGKSVLVKIRTINLLEDDKNYIISITNYYFSSKYQTIINNITNTNGRCIVCNKIHQTPKILTNILNEIKEELKHISQ